MKTKIEVITNFNELNKDCQEKIYSDLGCSLAQTYLESLSEPNLDERFSAGKLKLNTYEATNNDTETSSRKLQSSSNESYRSNQQPTNTHLPINENDKSSEPTEGQNKD